MKNPVMSRHKSGIVTGSFAFAQDDGVKKLAPSPYADHDHISTKALSGQRALWPG